MALLKVSLAGAVTALGGAVGYFLVGSCKTFCRTSLAVASSSFVYVALADLIPQLQKRLTARETIAQISLADRRDGRGHDGEQGGAQPLSGRRA